MSARPATSCAAARLRNRDNHALPAESSIAFGSHVIPPSKSAMSPFAAMHGAQTWALQPGPLQAAPTRWRTRSSKQVSSGGAVRAGSGNASHSSRLRRQHLAPVHFAFQAQHGFSRREPQHSRITLTASTSALLPTLFASSQSSALRISGRRSALSCSHSSRQHGRPCPDAQPQLVHHPRLVHVEVSSPLPAISLRLLNHALGYRRSAR